MAEWIPVIIVFAVAIAMTYYFASRQFKKRKEENRD